MAFTLIAGATAVALFFGMLGLEEYGFRRGRARAVRNPGSSRHGLGSVEGAVYGLLGLLIAFSFSGAGTRYEHRRDQIIAEANALSTAYLRLDVLPADRQPSLRAKFRSYVDARLSIYHKLPDVGAAEAELARANALQGEVWKEAVPAALAGGQAAVLSLLPALNEAFDLATERTAAAYWHPPLALFGVLMAVALLSAYLVGDGMSESPVASRLHMVVYAAVLAIVVYVVIDLEFPRFGLIRLTEADRFLAEVRQSMR
jgi:hypothetical protein